MSAAPPASPGIPVCSAHAFHAHSTGSHSNFLIGVNGGEASFPAHEATEEGEGSKYAEALDSL